VTKEQERARARRRQQKLDAREAERARQSARNRQVAIVVVAVLAVVGLFVFLSTQLSDDSGDPAAQPSASASPSATGTGRCAPAPATPKSVTPVDKPAPSTAAGKKFEAVATTNCGDITLELDGEKAPQTVASFLALAKADYWAKSPCHRLTTQGIFVLQCGDPLGGAGPGPGYTYGLENTPKDGSYPKGTLAMARTSDPNSNSGQFFIVYDDTQLPTEGGGYSIFGTVTAGMDIVEEIAAAGVAGGAGDGAPATPISILKVAVTEKKA
jgi:peptidyl-prolyl cis-trans isomerase B (cyclophilin B)